MQTLNSVRGTIVRTNVLDNYLDVQVNPSPICTQDRQQFYLVTAKFPGSLEPNDSRFLLRLMEHSTDAEEFNLEIECILESLNLSKVLLLSRNIAKVYGVKIAKDTITGLTYSETLLEDCGENLLDYVIQKGIIMSDLSEYIDQVIQALAYVNSKKLFHGNLNSGKIFVKEKRVKVIDFGGSLFTGLENEGNARKLLESWNKLFYPPDKYELLDTSLSREEKQAVLFSFDVYSLGMVCYQLLTKKSAKLLEKESESYKKSETAYRKFLMVLSEISEMNRPDITYLTYFEPFFRQLLEYERRKRPTIMEIYEKSKRSYDKLHRKNPKQTRDPDLGIEDSLSESDVYEESKEELKFLCDVCSKETSGGFKAVMDCNHRVCERCVEYAIRKITVDRTESIFELYCFVCKDKKKLKTVNLKCECSCVIENARNSNKIKILSFDRDKKKLLTAYCNNGHELMEDEIFMIFGNLKLSLRDEKLTKQNISSMENALERMELIEIVDLAQNQIDYSGLDTLVSIFAHKEALRIFQLDWNPIGPNGGKVIMTLLENSTSLKILSMGMSALTL